MKFVPKQHIVGKVYDLTQENMNAMIAHIEELSVCKEDLALAVEALEHGLRGLVWFLEGPYGPSPSQNSLSIVRKALEKIRGIE